MRAGPDPRDCRGFGLLETLVSLTVLTLAMGALATMLINNSQINKRQQMTSKAQGDTRNCMSLIVQKLRSAGWDPEGIGFDAVSEDPDPDDGISWIELRADLNGDGDLDEEFEQLLIRHTGNVVEWRTTPGGDFVALAEGITNDADGDGQPERMFIAHGTPAQTVEVKITAESPDADPLTGEPIRYTMESEIELRPRLLPLR